MIHSQVSRFHTWLEGYCPPFPDQLPSRPPETLTGFVVHYAKPFWPLILVCAFLSIIGSTIDVYLFSFVGNLVDWLATEQPDTFWETYQTQLIFTGILVLVIAPSVRYIYEAVSHQGLLGNFAMRTRWQAHRYLLRQSVEFYQNDFAGRVAAKMMQTSLGVRDAVIKVTEVLLYVVVYFTAAIILFAQSDIRLTAPMIFWLCGYIVTLRYFIPKMRQISMEQAEARSMVTGRVVDSYTNITTVKMFADGDAEDVYAREGMRIFLDTVYRQMRLSTFMTMALVTLNSILLFSVAATSIYLWQVNAVSVGAIAFAMGLVLRMQGMSQWILWEIAGLFENVGVIQDGIETISRDVAIRDHANADYLEVKNGDIDFKDVTFNYGSTMDRKSLSAVEVSLKTSPSM